MIRMTQMTRRWWLAMSAFTAAMAVGTPSSWGQPATTAPSATTQPGAVAVPRTEQAIIADLQENAARMREMLAGGEALTDPAKRAELAPQIVPIFKRLVSDFDELTTVQPQAKGQAEGAKQQFTV